MLNRREHHWIRIGTDLSAQCRDQLCEHLDSLRILGFSVFVGVLPGEGFKGLHDGGRSHMTQGVDARAAVRWRKT